MWTIAIRHVETFVVAFLATSIVGDLITKGWAGIDLAAAWAAVGSYFPWFLAGMFGTWLVLTVGERVWTRCRRRADGEGAA